MQETSKATFSFSVLILLTLMLSVSCSNSKPPVTPDETNTGSPGSSLPEFFRHESWWAWNSFPSGPFDVEPHINRIYSGAHRDFTGIDSTTEYPFEVNGAWPIGLVGVGKNSYDGTGGVEVSEIQFTAVDQTMLMHQTICNLPAEFVQDLAFVETDEGLYLYVMMENWANSKIRWYKVTYNNANEKVVLTAMGNPTDFFAPESNAEATSIAAVYDTDWDGENEHRYIYIYIAYQQAAKVTIWQHDLTDMQSTPELKYSIEATDAGWGTTESNYWRGPYGIAVTKNELVGVEEENPFVHHTEHMHIVALTSNANTGRIEVYNLEYPDYSSPPDENPMTVHHTKPFWLDWQVDEITKEWEVGNGNGAIPKFYFEETPYYPTLRQIDIDYLTQASVNEGSGPRVRIAVAYPNISTSHIEIFKAVVTENGVSDLVEAWSIDNFTLQEHYPQDNNQISRNWDPVSALSASVFAFPNPLFPQLHADLYGVVAVHGHYQFWSLWNDW